MYHFFIENPSNMGYLGGVLALIFFAIYEKRHEKKRPNEPVNYVRAFSLLSGICLVVLLITVIIYKPELVGL